MKSLIIYASHHHGSTETLVKAIAEKYPVDVWNAATDTFESLGAYDVIGFASGIDFGKFYPEVTRAARSVPAGKSVYALFTCARDNGKYGDEIREIAAEQKCTYLGKFGCKGYNTYGPWKLIGGMNKDHPSADEIAAAVQFYETVLSAVNCYPNVE